MAARVGVFGPEILAFCRSRAAGSSCEVDFLNWQTVLHRCEGRGHDRRSLRWRVEERGFSTGPEIFRFGRSWAVEDPCMVSFAKFGTDMHSFEGLSRWSSRVCGGAWWLF